MKPGSTVVQHNHPSNDVPSPAPPKRRLGASERRRRDTELAGRYYDDGWGVDDLSAAYGLSRCQVWRIVNAELDRMETAPLRPAAHGQKALRRFDAISARAMRSAAMAAGKRDWRMQMVCYRTAIFAELGRIRLLESLGVLTPDLLPPPAKPDSFRASEIRALAEQVRTHLDHEGIGTDDELISKGERDFLDGTIVEDDGA